jgi:hypothetical protein
MRSHVLFRSSIIHDLLSMFEARLGPEHANVQARKPRNFTEPCYDSIPPQLPKVSQFIAARRRDMFYELFGRRRTRIAHDAHQIAVLPVQLISEERGNNCE